MAPSSTRNYVRVELDEPRPCAKVATVTVDFQEKLNILNSTVMREMISHLDTLAEDDGLRAVVLTGAGEKAFIGGADLREMADLNPESATAFITDVHRVCAGLRSLPVPVIARISGYCLGAGLEVAAACDMRVAQDNAVFGMPEVRVGVPSVVEAALLPQLIGWGRTRELLLTGRTISASEALDWGLIERLAAPSELDAAVEGRIADILDAAPLAVRQQKALIREWERLPLELAIQVGIGAFADAYRTPEPAKAMRTFLESRKKPRPNV